mgnify:CR=1 FL=1
MNNGKRLSGHLIGYCEFEDGRSYDLETATEVTLISYNATPAPQDTIQSDQSARDNLWELKLADPKLDVYSIRNPRFAFRYYTGEGYSFGGTYRNKVTDSFYLKSEGKETLAYLSDFDEIVFEGDTIGLRAVSGQETTGKLLLKAKDSEGYHNAINWYLVMDSNEDTRRIILKNPNCSLIKETG